MGLSDEGLDPEGHLLLEGLVDVVGVSLVDLLAHEHGGSVVSAVLGDLDDAPEAWWDALMAARPVLQEYYEAAHTALEHIWHDSNKRKLLQRAAVSPG